MVKSFQVTLEDIREVADKLTAAFKKGLEDEKDAVVKMFITYVHSLPDGTEEGDFLALDLGGSNFRVLQLSEQSLSLSLTPTTHIQTFYVHEALSRPTMVLCRSREGWENGGRAQGGGDTHQQGKKRRNTGGAV